jgi:hypothetical protein
MLFQIYFMRHLLILMVMLTGITLFSRAQSVGIGTNTPAASAMLHINSTNKGLLIPRLTTAQRTAIASPASGLQVYDTNTNSFWYFNGAGWIELAAGGGGGGTNTWNINDTNIYNNNSGRVGIGTPTPLAKLSVVGTGQWGTASFTGSTRTSHINYGTEEHTYIRGGKPGSNVIISDDDGNVGIGTATPYNKLDVVGKITATANAMGISNIFGFNGGVFSLTNTDGNGQTITIDGSNIQSTYYAIGGLQYRPVVLNPYGGNVGIGTNYSPNFAKLEIKIDDEQRGWAVGTATYNVHTFLGGAGRTINSEGCYIGTSGTVSDGSAAPLHFFTNAQWAQMTLLPNGSVGIGTTNPDPYYKLSVNGFVRAKEIRVNTDWADYVFENDYSLKPLAEVETFIQQYKHLPGIKDAATLQKEGVDISAMQTKMMEKIEELTLYLIQANKQILDLQQQVQQLPKN